MSVKYQNLSSRHNLAWRRSRFLLFMPDLPVRQPPVGGSHTEAAPDGNNINAPSVDGDEHNCFPLKKLPC